MIASLRDQGTTIVLTTHYLDEAEALADEIAVLAKGTVVAAGPPSEIGGRNRRTNVVFRLDDAVLDDPPIGGHVDGSTWGVTTDDVTTIVRQLSGWASDHQTVLNELRVDRPSLEDVHLELTSP